MRNYLIGPVVGVLSVSSLVAAEKYALLAAVDDYPEPVSDLPGCTNDLNDVRDLLIKRFDFKPENIKTLIDEEVTTPNLKSGIKRHLGQAKAGDVAFFYYTGHGTHVPDLNHDEVGDARDEAIVTCDLNPRDPNTWMTDDVIGLSLAHIKTKKLFVAFDMCHAGTGTRALGAANTDASVKQKYTTYAFSEALSFTNSATKSSGVESNFKSLDNHYFIGACSPHETSLLISEVRDGKRQGCSLFTKYFVKHLGNVELNSALSDVSQRIKSDVSAHAAKLAEHNGDDHTQTPMWQGSTGHTVGEILGMKPSVSLEEEAESSLSNEYTKIITSTGEKKFTLALNKEFYAEGDSLSVKILPKSDGHLALFYIDSTGEVHCIYPNKLVTTSAVKAGKRVRVPGPLDNYKLTVKGDQGYEVFVALISDKPLITPEEVETQNSESLHAIVEQVKARNGRGVGAASITYKIH